MTSEENVKTAELATPKPLNGAENVALLLKLLFGAGVLALIFWYVDGHVTR